MAPPSPSSGFDPLPKVDWRSVDLPPPSRMAWTMLVPVAVLFAWLPLGAYWQSDDFIALHYSQDLGRAASDLVGPQYGSQDLWLFYRPLITLSFWVEQAFAGPSPMLSHMSNTVAHALSAWLLVLVWSRFASPWAAAFGGLLWGLLPSHAGSILWTVGRVDSHTVLWIALCVWLTCKAIEKRCPLGRWGAVACFALALMSKELAVVTPALVAIVAWGIAPPDHRLRTTAATLWPYVLLLGAYFGLRHLLLGVWLGGYAGGPIDPLGALQGWGRYTLQILNPWQVGGGDGWASVMASDHTPAPIRDTLPAEAPGWLRWAGYVPIALAVVLAAVRRRWIILAVAVLAYAISCTPLVQFLGGNSLQNLRYFYLPTAALIGIFVAAGPWASVVALLFVALPLLDVRQDYFQAHKRLERMHRLMLKEGAGRPAGEPMFVAGLPPLNSDGNVVMFHYGCDRLLQPPFATTAGPTVYPLRPAALRPGTYQLPTDPAFALPGGTSWFFEGPEVFGELTARGLPDLKVELRNIDNFSSTRLQALKDSKGQVDHPDAAFLHVSSRATAFRISIFTSVGYLTAIVEPRLFGPWMDLVEGGTDLNLYGLLRDGTIGFPGSAGGMPLLDALQVPTALDLQPHFPVLVEAGDIVVGQGLPVFEAKACARELLTFEFDRGFPRLLTAFQGRQP